MRALLRLPALLVLAAAAAPEAFLELPDGRRVRGEKLVPAGSEMILETAFGPLKVPRALLRAPGAAATASRSPEARWTKKTRWFEIDNDLTEERAALYAEEADGFFDWIAAVWGMDPAKLRKRGAFPLHVFRTFAAFKAVRARVAPGIEKEKGSAFAEGSAGFHSAGGTYLWDRGGDEGDTNLDVLKHELTHLANGLFAAESGTRFPIWLEEGAATYFEATVAMTGKEPEDEPAALATVLDDVESGKPMGYVELRSVPYATFYGREYSWGWALVRFLRRDAGGARWKPFVEFQRSASATPSESEDSRFFKVLGFKDAAALDRAWQAHLAGLRSGPGEAPLGASARVLEEVEKIRKPTADQARRFQRVGEALARKDLHGPAVVYLRAALRGGASGARVSRLLAGAIAGLRGLGPMDPWPEECVDLLAKAVAADPLRASLRGELGRQARLRAASPKEKAAARDGLGLALLLAGPSDDAVEIAMEAVRAAVAAGAEDVGAAVAWLGERAPDAKRALDTAHAYLLQEAQEWDALLGLLESRAKAGSADREERRMLAGLYAAAERHDEAAVIFAALLEETPDALHLWPDLVDALARAGKRREAEEARKRGLAALAAAPEENEPLRKRLEEIEIR